MSHEFPGHENADNDRITASRHSGHEGVPEDMREVPVEPYLTTSLEDAEKKGFLGAPNDVNAGFAARPLGVNEQAAADQRFAAAHGEREEPKKKSNKGKIAIGTALGLVLAGGGVVAGANMGGGKNETPTEPQPTAEAPVTPGATEPTFEPTPVATPTPTDIAPIESIEPTPADYVAEMLESEETKRLMEMPLDEFLSLPVEEREALAREAAGHMDDRWLKPTLGDLTDIKNGTAPDVIMLNAEQGVYAESDLHNYNPFEVASKDNTLEEIAMQYVYMMQVANSVSYLYGTEGAKKILSANFVQHPSIRDADTGPTVADNQLFQQHAATLVSRVNNTVLGQEIEAASSRHAPSRVRNNVSGETHYTVDLSFSTSPVQFGLEEYQGAPIFVQTAAIWDEDVNRWVFGDGYFRVVTERRVDQ